MAAVAAVAFWLFGPSKGGETADVVARDFEARGCSGSEREDGQPEDLPHGLGVAGEEAEELVEISCSPPIVGPTIYLLRFASSEDVAATAAADPPAGRAEYCVLEKEILTPGVGSTGTAKQLCGELGGLWQPREQRS